MAALVAALVVVTEGQPTAAITDYGQFYDSYANSAINMDGFSYYVNFLTPSGNLSVVLALCYNHPTCVSFDFETGCTMGACGWLHRITRDCAGSASAAYTDGDSQGTVFYQLKPAVLIAKDLNRTQCSHVKEAYEPDYKTSSMAGRLVAATLGTFVLVGGVLFGVQRVLQSRARSRLIEDIIDADEGMDEGDMPVMRPGQAADAHARQRPNNQPQPNPPQPQQPQPIN